MPKKDSDSSLVKKEKISSFTSLQFKLMDTLEEGQTVDYDVVETDRGPQAQNVVVK